MGVIYGMCLWWEVYGEKTEHANPLQPALSPPPCMHTPLTTTPPLLTTKTPLHITGTQSVRNSGSKYATA